MRRYAVAVAAAVTLLVMGYAASGVGNASEAVVADSSSSSTTLSTSTTTTTTTTTSSTTTTTPSTQPKVTICHRTKSKKNPYRKIRVSGNALKAHMKHGGDIIPAPATGCPNHVVLVKNHKIVKKKKKK